MRVLPDTIYTPNGYIPAEGQIEHYYTMREETEWYPALNGSPATTLEIELPNKTPGQLFSMVLGIGIRFGTITTGNQVKQLKRTGSAKILAMA